MNKADKMFEKLGYKKRINLDIGTEKIISIGYTQNETDEAEECSIIFLTGCKKIIIGIAIDMQELQAINEKVKELGWLDVK